MHSVVVGFGLGFLVALQLGPMSLFLVRSTLRAGWRVGLAIAGGIAIVDALYAPCTLATGTAVARRAIGERATRIADSVAGLGMLSFGGVLASTAVHDR